MSISTQAPGVERVPFNTLAIPFALCGLASVWTAGAAVLGFTSLIPLVLWMSAATALFVLIVEHFRRGRKSTMTLAEQLLHPGQGPLAALVPIVGMLLGNYVATALPVIGHSIVWVSVVTSLGFTLWLLYRWLTGDFHFAFVHGGYLLPTAAASFIMSIVTVRMGEVGFALGMFIAGIVLWLFFAGLIGVRLVVGHAWPDPLVPTRSMLLAPPAIAMVAWVEIFGLRTDLVLNVLAVCVVIMLVLQLVWLPSCLRITYSLGFWAFTFPTAATSLAAILWFRATNPEILIPVTVGLLVLITALVGMNSFRSVSLLLNHHRGLRAAEHDLTIADELVGD